MYERYREELTAQFRYEIGIFKFFPLLICICKKIPDTCRRFFDDYRNEQFKFISSTNGLVERVVQNFKLQMDEDTII